MVIAELRTNMADELVNNLPVAAPGPVVSAEDRGSAAQIVRAEEKEILAEQTGPVAEPVREILAAAIVPAVAREHPLDLLAVVRLVAAAALLAAEIALATAAFHPAADSAQAAMGLAAADSAEARLDPRARAAEAVWVAAVLEEGAAVVVVDAAVVEEDAVVAGANRLCTRKNK
jgi:hypothetical protein